MTQEEADIAAQGIITKSAGKADVKVSCDNPRDFDRSVKAFKKLGCRVKVHGDTGTMLVTLPH